MRATLASMKRMHDKTNAIQIRQELITFTNNFWIYRTYGLQYMYSL